MTNEYIRMILALPDEFFEGWRYNLGDVVLIGEELVSMIINRFQSIYNLPFSMLNVNMFNNKKIIYFLFSIGFYKTT